VRKKALLEAVKKGDIYSDEDIFEKVSKKRSVFNKLNILGKKDIEYSLYCNTSDQTKVYYRIILTKQ